MQEILHSNIVYPLYNMHYHVSVIDHSMCWRTVSVSMTKEKTVHLVFILLGKYWIKNNSFAKKQVIIYVTKEITPILSSEAQWTLNLIIVDISFLSQILVCGIIPGKIPNIIVIMITILITIIVIMITITLFF